MLRRLTDSEGAPGRSKPKRLRTARCARCTRVLRAAGLDVAVQFPCRDRRASSLTSEDGAEES